MTSIALLVVAFQQPDLKVLLSHTLAVYPGKAGSSHAGS